ncbi:hypothetical protein B0J14DRAFT_187574 [Halenospora varia]|nr:hypothetical protein B0J14DRAFT_187574 [Halenospora varia]
MDATLQKIVSDLLVRLQNPLIEVSDLPFKQLGDGTIVRQICEYVSGLEMDVNEVLAACVSTRLQPLDKFLAFVVIYAISSPNNNYYFVTLLRQLNPIIGSPIQQLLHELDRYGQSPRPPDDDAINQIPPLHISRESSVEQPPVLRVDIQTPCSEGETEQTTTNDLVNDPQLLQEGTELSLPSFETRDSYGDSSWIDHERLETQEKQTDPKVIFGIVGDVDYMPRNSDASMCKLTPLSGPQSKKRYRTTPHPGDRMGTASPSPSPLAKKGSGNGAPPWRGRT